MVEQAIWWTAAAILSAVGLLGAGVLFALLVTAFCVLTTKRAKLAYLQGKAWADLHRFVRAGRPEWRVGADGVYRMVPTDGPWSDDPALKQDP